MATACASVPIDYFVTIESLRTDDGDILVDLFDLLLSLSIGDYGVSLGIKAQLLETEEMTTTRATVPINNLVPIGSLRANDADFLANLLDLELRISIGDYRISLRIKS